MPSKAGARLAAPHLSLLRLRTQLRKGQISTVVPLIHNAELLLRGVQGEVYSCFWLQVSGQVDQSAGMLDEGAKAKGYALLCVSEPQSNCRIRVIDEVCPVL